MQSELEEKGRVWVRDALNARDLQCFEQVLGSGVSFGNRLDWSESLTQAAGISSKMSDLAQNVMAGSRPVRFLSFNKTSELNWSLPWHQDRVIAVNQKVNIDGFDNWSLKSGIWHCEAPAELLETMVFARVHLDDEDDMTGSLELSLGSHKFGKVLSDDVESIVENLPKEQCQARRGDVLFVKALTLHRSAVSRTSSLRRAIRIDYANFVLPEPLAWKY